MICYVLSSLPLALYKEPKNPIARFLQCFCELEASLLAFEVHFEVELDMVPKHFLEEFLRHTENADCRTKQEAGERKSILTYFHILQIMI